MRVPFLLAMLLMLCAMLCAGRIAKKEFGWRIFKMCGTKIEMLRVYEIIYSLSAVLTHRGSFGGAIEFAEQRGRAIFAVRCER